MAKSDNNRTLVCGAEMLQQGRLGAGVPRVRDCVCVFVCSVDFSACCHLIC